MFANWVLHLQRHTADCEQKDTALFAQCNGACAVALGFLLWVRAQRAISAQTKAVRGAERTLGNLLWVGGGSAGAELDQQQRCEQHSAQDALVLSHAQRARSNNQRSAWLRLPHESLQRHDCLPSARGARGADIARCGARKNYCEAASPAPRVPQVNAPALQDHCQLSMSSCEAAFKKATRWNSAAMKPRAGA